MYCFEVSAILPIVRVKCNQFENYDSHLITKKQFKSYTINLLFYSFYKDKIFHFNQLDKDFI